MEPESLKNELPKFGYQVSVVTAILTIITFAIAVMTPPLSGPFCASDCFEYPYTNIADRFPRDYYWMYFAMVMMIAYLAMMVSIHQTVENSKKHFSLISISFAIMATMILFTNYFIQVSVIQPSILAGETDGISLLSQFNPKGVFIVLEEVGFLFMVPSFFVLTPTFSEKNSNQKAIRWISIIGFLFTMLAFILISMMHGINREYRFEVAIITIAWIELIVLGFLYARFYSYKITRKSE